MDKDNNLVKLLKRSKSYKEFIKDMNNYEELINSNEFKEVRVESFWGAIATLVLYQIFGFIAFQAFLSYLKTPLFLVFGSIWIFAFMVADAVTFKKIKNYLGNEFTTSPLNSLKQLDDFIKFCVTIFFAFVLLLFIVGHYPFPFIEFDSATLFAYYIFSWIVSYIISLMLKKTKPSIKITKNRQGLVLGFTVGISFFLISYFTTQEVFYLVGMVGLGFCIMIISSWLLDDQIKTI